ncbi:hypothetical protein [Granulicella tundricola]|uniref:hypothetical protein n=1 Tax=Granulicella tundricola TaxID=940615 RepID=UPI0018DE2FDE
MKNLISMLGDPGGSFSPGKLDYTITGADASQSHALAERDGSFSLFVWLEHSSYNAAI